MALSKLCPELLNHLVDFAYEDAPGPVRRRLRGKKAPQELLPSSPAPLAAEIERVNRDCAKILYPRLVKIMQMDHRRLWNTYLGWDGGYGRAVPSNVPVLRNLIKAGRVAKESLAKRRKVISAHRLRWYHS